MHREEEAQEELVPEGGRLNVLLRTEGLGEGVPGASEEAGPRHWGAVQLGWEPGTSPHTRGVFFSGAPHPGGNQLDCSWGLRFFWAGALGRQGRTRLKEDGEMRWK